VVCGGLLKERAALRLGRNYLRICGACGSWTYLPRATAAEQSAIHDTEEYFDHPYFQLRRVITPSHRRRVRELFRRVSAAMDVEALRGERVLDIGCDTGAFLKAAQQEFGIVPVGVDVGRRAVEVARQDGVEAYHTAIEQAPAGLSGFSLITAIDLIEHVPNPGALLGEIYGRLRAGGVAYIETPNIRSVVYRFGRRLSTITGGRPASLIERLFPPQHIQYFTDRSLRELAGRAGFQVVSITTRPLPASDIAASRVALLPIQSLQAADRVLGTEILLCAVLQRPAAARGD
jgi:2-polyprenyl-3-methyl-5-hydroxy-6-metoxy-1,4-benzoquinol methylase